MNHFEYRRRFKRFVQGIITEEEFRAYLFCALSKEELIALIVSGAKNLRQAVAIGESLNVEC